MRTNPLYIFTQPYPCEVSRNEKAWLTFVISVFVFLFLLAFSPFGLNQYDFEQRLFICLGYGLACAMAMIFNLYVLMPALPELFDESRWTVGRQLIWTGWILFTISLFNSIYSVGIGMLSFSFYNLLISTLQVVAVGIFPVAAIVLIDYLRLFRKHARKAEQLDQHLSRQSPCDNTQLVLVSENDNEKLQLTPDELLYITSADNYVAVNYRINDSIKKTLLRGTLKKIDQQLHHPNILRCHRSYIVNLKQLVNITGNARGYILTLRGTDSKIPVSKTYAEEVMQQVENL